MERKANSLPSTRLSISKGRTKPPNHKWKKGDENESDSKTNKCLNCGLENLYTPERSAPIWICTPELSERKPLGKGLPLQKPRRNTRQAGVKTDATDEDPQVENVEMEIKEN